MRNGSVSWDLKVEDLKNWLCWEVGLIGLWCECWLRLGDAPGLTPLAPAAPCRKERCGIEQFHCSVLFLPIQRILPYEEGKSRMEWAHVSRVWWIREIVTLSKVSFTLLAQSGKSRRPLTLGTHNTYKKKATLHPNPPNGAGEEEINKRVPTNQIRCNNGMSNSNLFTNWAFS